MASTLSYAPNQSDLVLVKGDDFSLPVTVVDGNGSPVDVSGYSWAVDILSEPGATTPVDSFSTSVGGSGNGTLTMSLTDTETDALAAPATYRWRLEATTGGVTRTWIAGRLTVLPAGTPGAPTSSAGLTVTISSSAITVAVSAYGLPISATEIAADNPYGEFNGATLQEILDVDLLPSNFLRSTAGGGAKAATIADATGAVQLDLGAGSAQHITSTTGNYTLSVTGASSAGEATAFTLIIDSSGAHTPTWFGNLSWPAGDPQVDWTAAASTREVFSFISLDGGATWMGWHLSPSPARDDVSYSIGGELTAAAGTMRVYNDSGVDRVITGVRASAGVAPVGAAILVDVNVDGSTVWPTSGDRASIAAGSNVATLAPVDAADGDWPNGSYLTVDVDQIGSSTAGSDLVVTVTYEATA